MNLVSKQSFPQNLSPCYKHKSRPSSTALQMPTDKMVAIKGGKVVRENNSKRIFGKELQNTETEEKLDRKRLTPSTQTSLPKSENEFVTCFTPHKRQNPQLVKPYKYRIREFLQKRDRFQKIDQKFISNQEDINSKMRSILVDWLVDVSVKFKFNEITLFSAICLLDKFLQTKQVQRNRLQLLGITCLMIVSKFEEIYPPSIKEFVKVCDKAYSQDEFLDSEADILQTLQFDIAVTPSIVFYRDFTQDIGFSPKVKCFGSYLLETSLLDVSTRKYTNREIACGTLFLINKIFKCGKEWDKDFSKVFNGVSENKVKICAKDLYKTLSNSSGSEYTAIKRKFATVENYEVSKYKVERTSKNKKK